MGRLGSGVLVTAEKWFGIISLFPEMFAPFTQQGVIGRAVKNGTLAVEHFNPRDYTHDRHRTVDDRPYGGGPGMLMMVKPLTDAITAAKQAGGENSKVIYLSPHGKPLTQAGVKSLAANDKLILLCGRYEGVDERVIESQVDEEWSIGDYVLSGGELPAMVMMDAIARLVPEVLDGKAVPGVLRSGDHEKIRQWRLQQSLGRTWLRRPELLNDLALTEEQQRLLEAFQASLQQDDS